MSRYLYILAGTLAVLAVLSFVVGPFSAPTIALGWAWRSVGLVLLVAGLVVALLATLTALFQQVDRRNRASAKRKRS